MKSSLPLILLPFFLLASFSWANSFPSHEGFFHCLEDHEVHSPSNNSSSISKLIYTPNDPSYFSLLNLSIQNSRFSSPFLSKPLVIITPLQASHVQAAIFCSKKHELQVRVRSGGHDYEGLSFVSKVPFVIIDLFNLRSVNVDVGKRTAWVQAGATIGEVYYKIAEASSNLGFPAGTCASMGVGGHFSGGGYGTMLRKYGLAADNIVDAEIVNVEGEILSRKSMGEDLFWAIRGGGGASFGVVLSWKLQLVPVPSIVTVFTVNRNLTQNATKLLHRWQYIAHKFHDDLFIRLFLQAVHTQDGKKTIQVSFNSLFLGGVETLIPLMQKNFPELGVVREDCFEMSWIESVVYFHTFRTGQPLDVLLERRTPSRLSFKGKSDFVTDPIPEKGLEGIWKRLYEEEVGRAIIIMSPYGGKMNEISESELPFPHRAGNIFFIQYLVYWKEEENASKAEQRISWIRRLYNYMAPFVSKNPRAAYLNYRDLDIGTYSNNGGLSYPSIWGPKYFNNNFDKLVQVKTKVDPTNFFKNEQSIPTRSALENGRD